MASTGTQTSRVNLVNLERVDKAYDARALLASVSLGVAEGDRIGVVGRNGTGKTTLLRLLAGREGPDGGRIARPRDLRIAVLGQHDSFPSGTTVGEVVVPDQPIEQAVRDRRVRDVLSGLLADIPTERTVDGLSGGERRRVALARVLVGEHDLLLLDEPTNHLDIEVTDWLAGHLAARREALVVVTHDRWFLDAVCTQTWELVDSGIEAYEGGYSAYVLAKAERARTAGKSEEKRQNLLRKELAWLHRGAKARTSKPKFRLDRAAELIGDEPPPRDTLELAKFATQRLGKTVIDLHDVDVVRGQRTLLERLNWQLGPGDRIGVVGVNGAGKTSLLRVLAGDEQPDAGRLVWGRTVALGHLSQELGVLDSSATVLDAIEQIRRIVKLAPENVRPGAIGRRPVPTSGPEVTATSLLERFGFRGDMLRARVGDLSGGERRRLELLGLLLDEPNVLLLDEPTNDLDIETLRLVEDFLDNWPGSLVVVTHDRYFLERVCDTVWALLGDGSFGLLPGGVDEYLSRRRVAPAAGPVAAATSAAPRSDAPNSTAAQSNAAKSNAAQSNAAKSTAAEERAAKKELAKLERQLTKLSSREEKLTAAQAEHASDYERLMEFEAELRELRAEKDAVETEWLRLAEQLSD